ncbi:DUF6510 family protein [Streptomyces sp. NPDC004959]|uniref:DUF6510 family protein n=1 Tax=unclassified Streptomyces TaxID=2593676 RepID=UPI0004C90E53|nr:DUF6510 family protein [Streptomyces sp. NRRL F-5630]
MTSAHLDGNALAGPLAPILAVDPTTAWRHCPDCGTRGPLAGLRVYGPEPGLTARCPGCAAVALRIMTEGAFTWLSLGGPDGAFRFRTG